MADEDEERRRQRVGPDRGLRLRWAVVPVLFAAMGYAVLPLQSWDYWWHITVGRMIAATGEIPSGAMFLYTMEADAPSIIQPWLSQWLLFTIHDTFGLRANLCLRGLVIAGSFGAATWLATRESDNAMVTGLFGVAGLVVAFPFLDVRTNLFVLPLFVATVAIARGVRASRITVHALWGVPVVAALWANLHGSFLLPGGVCLMLAAAGLWDRWRCPEESDASTGPLAAAGLGALAAPLANPHGVDVYRYVYQVATDPVVQATITEWQPTTPAFPPVGGPVFYLLVAALGLIVWTRRATIDTGDVVLLVGFGMLAGFQARGLIWFGLAVPMTAAPYVEPGRPTSEWPRAGTVAVAVAGLVAIAGQPCWPWWPTLTSQYQAVPVRTEPPYRGTLPEEAPVAVLERLQQIEQPPRLFHDERHAGFYLFHLLDASPRRLVFVDQRVELPPADLWRTYIEVSRGEHWQSVFQMYRVGAVAVHRERQSGLAAALEQAPGWTRVVEGEATSLYLPRKAARRSIGD